MSIKTKDIKLAEVRYFDEKNNGLEYTKPLSNVILFHRGDTYVNLLNPIDFAPVFERVKAAIGTRVGYVGTPVRLVCGEAVSGEAWLLTDTDFSKVFGSEEVELRDIEDYVLNSELFFKDRVAVAEERFRRSRIGMFKLVKIIDKDQTPMNEMRQFFAEREAEKVKKK